ncbi:excinuclease ABC subunit C [Candidatus Kaiserbacteria bacterium RIFCSPHIGHO2_01_FULL_48_10]|uniref:Excinuclease ABC subunit C n=1 Tax=Candidatus Kaiserbacteria bacterium RIFCSPHIGHO2_01_FULL_48_10 TaxID=1798476 RepID=A0A1F6C524_9BACT|nr:MAG: excinuclease ABC subunit C [Candidatus Kaiserbacteria bacterium RIFCSPHIGHO2_01_FULL_48_10]
MSWYIYILRSKNDGKWYTGITNNLRKRFKSHNEGTVRSTKGRGPFEIIYCEISNDEDDTRARERYLKTGMGKRYLKNRLKRFLSLTG